MENNHNQYIQEEAEYRSKDGYSFSTPLKIRLTAYFRNEYDLDITDEEANLFLASLAGLYGALSDAARQAPRADSRLSGSGSVPDSEPETQTSLT